MPEVVAAYAAYKQTDKDVLLTKFRARAQLGRTVYQERKKAGHTQDQVAETLGVVTNQVRRYEQAYRQWCEKHPNEPLD